MKNKIMFVGLVINLFFVDFLFAQICVKNNSYIFNKGTVIYAKGNLELDANSNFYLRNEGQFLQGTTGTSTNTGTGKLSVFQEGTANNFIYNYWCSPVGNTTAATSGNEDFGITLLNVPTTNRISSPATISSTTYDGVSSAGSLSIASYWIFRFLSSSTYSGWLQSGANTNIAPGQGFTMKGVSGSDATNVGETVVNNPGSAQRYDFRGKPNDGNITVNVARDQFTLTGNPYPSALHVNAFLLDPANSDCTGVAYYWEQDKTVASHLLLAYRGGYGTYAPGGTGSTDYGVYVPAFFSSYTIDGTLNTTGTSSGLVIERKYAPIGQGFMIKGIASGSPSAVMIKNSHRSYYKEAGTYSQFERPSQSNPITTNPSQGINTTSHLRFNVIVNNQNTRQLALTFMPNATDGVDRGIDAMSPDPDLTNDAYFFLDNAKYVIEGINFNIEKRVPLGLMVTNSTSFRFSLVQIVNFNESVPVYIFDNFDGTYHNLRNGDYEVTLPTGTYNNRFEITFKNDALSITNSLKEGVLVFQNNANQLLMVYNPNLLDIKSVTLFDISGKLLFNKVNLATKDSYEFSTATLSDGVYLVKIQSSDGQTKTQKIIISSN